MQRARYSCATSFAKPGKSPSARTSDPGSTAIQFGRTLEQRTQPSVRGKDAPIPRAMSHGPPGTYACKADVLIFVDLPKSGN